MPSCRLEMPRHRGPPSPGNGCPRTSRRPPDPGSNPPRSSKSRGCHPLLRGRRDPQPPPLALAGRLPIARAPPAPQRPNPAAARLEPEHRQTKHLPELPIPLAPPPRSRQAHPLTRTTQPFVGESWTGRKSQAAPALPAFLAAAQRGSRPATWEPGKRQKRKRGPGSGTSGRQEGFPERAVAFTAAPGNPESPTEELPESWLPAPDGCSSSRSRWSSAAPRGGVAGCTGARLETMARARLVWPPWATASPTVCQPARRSGARPDRLHPREHLAGSRQAPEGNSPTLQNHSLLGS